VEIRPREAQRILAEIGELIIQHHDSRASCVNMCVSEAVTSNYVRAVLGSDLNRRYWAETGDYAGGKQIQQIELIAVELARELFGTAHANIYPVSGHVALLAALYACTTPGGTVLFVPEEGGGYTAAGFAEKSGLTAEFFPFDEEAFVVGAEEAANLVRQVRPQAAVLGASTCPFPYPVREVAIACKEVGARLIYDASHVMGLIAGGEFQDPIGEGAAIMVGSTNKTFPGPHRGIILTNDPSLHERMTEILLPAPYLQSSHHAGTAAALCVALLEMQATGSALARAIVANSQILAAGLLERGVGLVGSETGLSQSHQVVIDCGGLGSQRGVEICQLLESVGILADVVVRLGTQQITRLGMGRGEMNEIADIVAHALRGETPEEFAELKGRASALARSFQTIGYGLSREVDTAYTIAPSSVAWGGREPILKSE
jgi:glycine hydroxymethyltransferase